MRSDPLLPPPCPNKSLEEGERVLPCCFCSCAMDSEINGRRGRSQNAANARRDSVTSLQKHPLHSAFWFSFLLRDGHRNQRAVWHHPLFSLSKNRVMTDLLLPPPDLYEISKKGERDCTFFCFCFCGLDSEINRRCVLAIFGESSFNHRLSSLSLPYSSLSTSSYLQSGHLISAPFLRHFFLCKKK